ncbi:MAG: YHS domain-containing (seleno)protein [Alphaproteobacteria bacterium]
MNQSSYGSFATPDGDPLCYFKEGKSVEGISEYTHRWMSGTWQFESAENREALAKSSKSYAPQFGGCCAWVVSQEYIASIGLKACSIANGKLYLNFFKKLESLKVARYPRNIASGITNWPAVLKDELNKA